MFTRGGYGKGPNVQARTHSVRSAGREKYAAPSVSGIWISLSLIDCLGVTSAYSALPPIHGSLTFQA